MATMTQSLDELCINTIRTLSIDAVQKANSGHPGLPLGAAPMAYVLWTRYMRHNPRNPAWADHDRFILSAGHGSMLLYSLLFLTGYDLPMDEIKKFFRANPQVLVLLIICLVLGLGTFLAVVFGLISAGSGTSSGEPSGLIGPMVRLAS